jgi:hypothetical protein
MTRSIRILLVLVSFVAITILLTWFWTAWGHEHYGYFLKAVAPPIYEAIGFGDARVGAFRQRYINFVPFIGLVLVTPGIQIRRRMIGLSVGVFALFVGHLALNLTERGQQAPHLPFVPSLVSDVLPFVFWIIVAYPVISGWFASVMTPAEALDAESSTNPHRPH